jgi:flavorubredoxin
MHQVKLTANIYYLGFNDRRTHLFENIWPIPYGVAYNSYLIDDSKVALIDTVDRQFIEDYLDAIEEILEGRPVDYLILNHVEPDHSGALRAVTARFPNITLVGNKKTFPLVENMYFKPVNVREVADGDTLTIGATTLSFHTVPMVHWPETMVTYDRTHEILFSGDAFGSFGTLDGGVFDDQLNLSFFEEEAMRYFTNIVGKYCPHTQRALAKLKDLSIKIIAATHGPLWRDNLEWILSRYRKWSAYQAEVGAVIVYGSMYGNTQKMAEAIARQLAIRGIKNIRIYDVSKTHKSYIISDIFKYKAFIAGSCAYNNELFPNMESLLTHIAHTGIKERYLSIFGNYAWSGGGVKNLRKFAAETGWELVGEPVEEQCSLKPAQFEACIRLADAVADKLGAA